MSVLVLAEHYSEISSSTLSAVAAAREFHLPVHLLVVGDDCQSIVNDAAAIAGVDKVLYAQAPFYLNPTAENLASLLLELAPQYPCILVAATVHGKAVLPRLAAMLDVAPVSDVVRIIDANTFERPSHAGNLLATIQCMESIRLLSVRASAFKPVPDKQKPVPIERIAAAEDTKLSRVELRDDPSLRGSKPSLQNARVVVSGGRGFDSTDDFYRLLNPLAEQLNAALGATRAIVDAGVTNNLQVGQSGLSIAPDLYFAFGLSGATQHISGIKNSKCIVAINRDSRAPICEYADYVLIANLYQAIPRLSEAIRKFYGKPNASPSAG